MGTLLTHNIGLSATLEQYEISMVKWNDNNLLLIKGSIQNSEMFIEYNRPESTTTKMRVITIKRNVLCQIERYIINDLAIKMTVICSLSVRN